MLDDDIQHEILRDKVEPERALSIAVNIEMGHQNQQRISSNNNGVNAIQQFTRFRGASARVQAQNNCFQPQIKWPLSKLWTKFDIDTPSGFSLPWVRNVTTVAFSIISLRYVGKQHNNSKNTQNKRINNFENSENTDQSDNQNENFINYNEQYNSEHDSSDDNYIAMDDNYITNESYPNRFAKLDYNNWQHRL